MTDEEANLHLAKILGAVFQILTLSSKWPECSVTFFEVALSYVFRVRAKTHLG